MTDILGRLDGMFNRFGSESNDDAARRRVQTAKDAAEEIEKLRVALHEIECSHIPDQPAAFEHSDLDWARLHVGKLRSIARAALGEKE
jgi:hypothetical protein